MAESPPETTKMEIDEMIREFESLGFMTFVLAHEGARYDALMDYARKYHVPTQTMIDDKEGLVTVLKRVMGSIEGLG